METRTVSAAAAGAVLALLLCGAAGAADYARLSAGIARAAGAAGISSISVGAFSAAQGAEEEARYAAEATAAGLAAAGLRAEAGASDVPAVPEMKWDAPPLVAPVPSDLRDAPADNPEPDCGASLKQLARINARALDLKARYWAARMRDPSFSYASLTRNPGSEIRDAGDRQKFYELLARYHDGETAPALRGDQARKLEDFMRKESAVISRCGLR